MAYLILFLGIVPIVVLLWSYGQFIHPNRVRLWHSLNRLSLPNKVGVISLGIAVIAFLYSIFYSSLSTYYTLEAVASAESSGIEQRTAFNAQMSLLKEQQSIMQKQQASLERTQQALEENVKLAQRQTTTLDDIKFSSKLGREISQTQLDLATARAEYDLRMSKLTPELRVDLTTLGHEKPFTQAELNTKAISIKPSKDNSFVSTIYVTNRSDKAAHNLTITIKALPETVRVYDLKELNKSHHESFIYLEDYMNYTLTSDRTIIYSFFSEIPPTIDRVVYTFKLSCDSPNSVRQFRYDFLVDHSLQNK